VNKKEEEKLIMQYFRESLTDFPKGKLTQSESPDFILKTSPKKSIGIELTRLDPFAMSLKEKIKATLQNKSDKYKLYQQKNMIAIWLIIHADFIEDPKAYNIQNKLNNWQFESEFDKVFLFDLFEKRIEQLIPYSGT
jgi:hypothetical protein